MLSSRRLLVREASLSGIYMLASSQTCCYLIKIKPQNVNRNWQCIFSALSSRPHSKSCVDGRVLKIFLVFFGPKFIRSLVNGALNSHKRLLIATTQVKIKPIFLLLQGKLKPVTLTNFRRGHSKVPETPFFQTACFISCMTIFFTKSDAYISIYKKHSNIMENCYESAVLGFQHCNS